MMAEMTVARLGQVLEHLGLRTDGNRRVLLCRLEMHVGLRVMELSKRSLSRKWLILLWIT